MRSAKCNTDCECWSLSHMKHQLTRAEIRAPQWNSISARKHLLRNRCYYQSALHKFDCWIWSVLLRWGFCWQTQNQLRPAGDYQHTQLQQMICADYREAFWVHATARWLCGTLVWLVALLFSRDTNHQACAAGMIKCHTAPSLLALTVN